jgi:Tol biopolymer transport system component
MSAKRIQGGLHMFKQLSVPQKILSAIVLLFAWSLFTEQVFADERTGRIAFLSDRNRNRQAPFKSEISVYLIDADGLNEKLLMSCNRIDGPIDWSKCGPIDWSPNGKYIAYHMQAQHATHIFWQTPVILPEDLEDLPREPAPKEILKHFGPGVEIFVVPDAPKIEIKNVTEQFGGQTYLSPKWSPDGKWLALTSTDGSPDGKADVCVMDIQGNQLKNLTQSPGIDEVGSWSPDGSKIVFFSNRDGNGEIYVMGSNGRKQVNLTNHPALDAAPTWSPDGTKIAFHSNREGDQDDIYAMNPDGANVVNLTRHPWEDRAPAWSPDGRWIAYHAFQVRTPPDIYVMDANGNNWARLTKHPDSDTDPTWVIRDRSLSVEESNNQATLWGRMKLERQ